MDTCWTRDSDLPFYALPNADLKELYKDSMTPTPHTDEIWIRQIMLLQPRLDLYGDWMALSCRGMSLVWNGSAESLWIAVSVKILHLPFRVLHLCPRNVDAHITLCSKMHCGPRFGEQLKKAQRKLEEMASLDLKVRCAFQFHGCSIWNFNVHSDGCRKLQALEHCLTYGSRLWYGMSSPEEGQACHRSISPPGPVFHVSIYQKYLRRQ